jgi:hypothetical protein
LKNLKVLIYNTENIFFVVKSKDDLIYELIFNEETNFKIDISEYITDIYRYEDFVSDMKKVLKKSKVKIVTSQVNIDSKTAIWELKVKK